jgi:threonine dehydratase
MQPTLADIRAAQARIAAHVRRTPLLAADDPGVWLKLENLQATGSFKARGAMNMLLSLDPTARARGLVTASGGNHGAAVAFAGRSAGAPVAIYAPANTATLKQRKIRDFGAELVILGDYWDQANAAALARAEADGRVYVHPFAEPAVIAGQGTVALEILADLPEVDTILVAIGGGGLISGIALAARALKPDVRIVGIEPVGCPTLKASLDAGRLTALERIDTRVATMAARQTAEINLTIARAHVAEIVLVEDDAMLEAARHLWLTYGLAADLSAAAAMAALRTGAYRPGAGETICALVCGAGDEAILDPG